MPLKSSKSRDWNSASPACSIWSAFPEGPEDLSGKSFLIWVVSSSSVRGSMKRGWVFGVAVDACACTEVWRDKICFASFSSYRESLWLTEVVTQGESVAVPVKGGDWRLRTWTARPQHPAFFRHFCGNFRMSRGTWQKLQRWSKYGKWTKLVFCTSSKKVSENRSSRFEPKISLISFSRGSGPPLILKFRTVQPWTTETFIGSDLSEAFILLSACVLCVPCAHTYKPTFKDKHALYKLMIFERKPCCKKTPKNHAKY